MRGRSSNLKIQSPFPKCLSSSDIFVDIAVVAALRLVRRKRHIETELSVRLSVLQLLHVGHIVQNRRRALSGACLARTIFMKKPENETFTAAGSRCRRNFK